jgi:pimeloyl-ACP methyl ester carboxylesterase
LVSLTVDDCVKAVIDDADRANLKTFALVGHSLGGVTITEAARRHPDRVAQLIYAGAIVPAEGQSAAELVFGADLTAEPGHPNEARCRATIGNDMTDDQWRAHWPTIVPEAAAIWNSHVSAPPTGIPTTYVSMADDAGAPPPEKMIANLAPGCDHRVTSGGHLAMVTKPFELAEVINDIVNC